VVVSFQDPREEVRRFLPPDEETPKFSGTATFAVQPGPPHHLVVASTRDNIETGNLTIVQCAPQLVLDHRIHNDGDCLLQIEDVELKSLQPLELRVFAADEFGNLSWNGEEQGRFLAIQACPRGHADDPILEILDPALGPEFQTVDDQTDLFLQLGCEGSKFLSWPSKDKATARIRIRQGSGRHPHCESRWYQMQFSSDGLKSANVQFCVYDAKGHNEAQRLQQQEYDKQRKDARIAASKAEVKRRELADASAKCRAERDAALRDALEWSGLQERNLETLRGVLEVKLDQSRNMRPRRLSQGLERFLNLAKESLRGRKDTAFVGTVTDLFQTTGAEENSVDDRLAHVLSWHIGSRMDMLLVKDEKAADVVHRNVTNLRVRPLHAERNNGFSKPHLQFGRGRFAFKCWFAYEVLEPTPEALRVAARKRSDAESALNALLWDLVRDTLLVENLDHAAAYRTSIVGQKNGKCPTILTLDGHRILANGERGGTGNTMPRGRASHELPLFGTRHVDAQRLSDALGKIHDYHKCEAELVYLKQQLDEQERAHRQLENQVVAMELACVQSNAQNHAVATTGNAARGATPRGGYLTEQRHRQSGGGGSDGSGSSSSSSSSPSGARQRLSR